MPENVIQTYALKTGIPVEERDSISKLLRRVSYPEIQLNHHFIINCNEIYFSSQEQIAYFLTQEAVYFLGYFKFLRVYIRTSPEFEALVYGIMPLCHLRQGVTCVTAGYF